jgi:hypothetical protein
MMHSMPVLLWFGVGLALFLVLGRAIGGRRDWTHAFVMLALAYVLLLGLWLPIAARVPVRVDIWGEHFKATRWWLEESPETIAAFALVPPLAVAMLYTLIKLRRPALLPGLLVAVAVVALFACSVLARIDANNGAFLIHDNFVHLLLAAVAIAIIAVNTLAFTTWLAGRRTARQLAYDHRDAAVSDDDSEVVGCLQITSWLRGPRLWLRSFTARTGGEELPIPSGANLATAMPKISSAMRSGEAVVVLSKSDPITLGGFVERDVGDSPFRSVKVMVPGPAGITVGRREPMSTPVESMLLTAWRPSVAYLLILLAVAVPSLAGLLVKGEP